MQEGLPAIVQMGVGGQGSRAGPSRTRQLRSSGSKNERLCGAEKEF